LLKKVLFGFFLILLLAAGGFVAWGSTPAAPMQEAVDALQSDGSIAVATEPWLVFQPAGQQPVTGLIYYPGGRVDYRAYAPYARAVAAQGFLVVIVPMPLNLAVMAPDRAAGVIEAFPQVEHWAIGGHSLGGAMAARYAYQHPDQIDGLVLIASYPAETDQLRDTGVKVLSIFGSLDGLATGDKIAASYPLLPEDTRYYAVEGGNHAQFGWYGEQQGDLPATISRDEQQAQAVGVTVEFLNALALEAASR
jgi:predicted alpha/beta-hydrolase family hydrolase